MVTSIGFVCGDSNYERWENAYSKPKQKEQVIWTSETYVKLKIVILLIKIIIVTK